MNRLAATAMILLGATATGTEFTTTLKGNPFSRPPSTVLPETAGITTSDGTVPEIRLQATMVGAGRGLANVGGRILRPGQEIEGLTLLKVYEDRAIFLYRGDRLTVYVKPHLNESDDED